MVPIKGEWIYNDYRGYVSEGFFDHEMGVA
jgi:hypothetical protein